MNQKLPVIFFGHGSPMNALADNRYTQTLNRLGRELPKPKAVLCVSAHWMTEGSWVTAMAKPKTIHDFYGFPQALFDVQYPAPGSPETAIDIAKQMQDPEVHLDREMWGLDHGTWSVLRHLYPEANIPTLQLSLYMEQPASYHYKLGQNLRRLREQGILIVGSGNIVHNLRVIRWGADAEAYPWATEFDMWSKAKIESRDDHSLTDPLPAGEAARLSIPTWEHYYPLLYVLGAATQDEKPRFEYEGVENGSISMRCVSFGR